MPRALATLCLALALAASPPGALAQEPPDSEVLEVRVTSARAGAAEIDRGASDGLEVGDRVRFFPRGGGLAEGTLAAVEERSATVELQDPSFVLPAGTRGKAWVPAERLAERAGAKEPERRAKRARRPPQWKNQDEEWREGEPLLATVEPLRPEQRPASVRTRLYALGDATWSSEDDRSDGFYRAGADVEYDNFFGRGEVLRFDGELNHRRTDVDDDDDESSTRMRFDRLSYTLGGTRFERARWEFGRFLQNGMPEFGVLDGVECTARLDDGDRYGASIGYMPEPDGDYDTGSDFQVAAHYRWVYDESERFTAAAGYQKSFHNAAADRDLFVGQVLYLPPEGWTFNGTAWVDLYTGGDDDKGSGLEPTQVLASTGRRWSNGSSVELTYSRIAFPEIERNEFTPVTDAQLADDHNDRLALVSRKRTSEDTRVRGVLGGWVDEDEGGGDLELALEIEELAFERDLTEFVVFGSKGRFTSTVGGRLWLGLDATNGRWRFGYEFAQHRLDGFTDDNDDLPQHRVSASRDFHTPSGWSFSGHVDASLWDHENSVSAGFYLQRSF